MLYEVWAFNAKGTVFRVILDSLDIELLDNMLDAVDNDTIVTRDDVEAEKVNTLKIIARALIALDRAQEVTNKEEVSKIERTDTIL